MGGCGWVRGEESTPLPPGGRGGAGGERPHPPIPGPGLGGLPPGPGGAQNIKTVLFVSGMSGIGLGASWGSSGPISGHPVEGRRGGWGGIRRPGPDGVSENGSESSLRGFG